MRLRGRRLFGKDALFLPSSTALCGGAAHFLTDGHSPRRVFMRACSRD